jgi:hypothetical protein
MDSTPESFSQVAEALDRGPSFIWRGLQYGFVAGFVASEIYLVTLTLTALGINTDSFDLLVIGQIFGVLPAMVLGAITGLITGILLEPLRPQLNTVSASALGMMVAFFIMLPLTVILALNFSHVTVQEALPYLPVATLFLMSGGVGGWRLFADDKHGKSISNGFIAISLLAALSIVTALALH